MSAILKKRSHRVRFLADTGFFYMNIIGLLIPWAVFGWIFYMVETSGAKGTDDLMGELLFLFLAMAMTITLTFSSSQWGVIVTLTQENISLKCPIRKREVYLYSEFPLVYRASYIHGLAFAPEIGSEIVFIVLSKRRMNDVEKRNINLIRNSRDLIIIKYSKKRYQQLSEILPQNLSAQMHAAFRKYAKRDDIALRRSAITAKARRRQKRKNG